MGRFSEDEERGQHSTWQSAPEDFVEMDNPGRVVDDFIDELDLGAVARK